MPALSFPHDEHNFGGQPMARLATEHSTPLYAYDSQRITRRIADLRALLPGSIGIHYAIKANPFPPVLRLIAEQVDGVDIAPAQVASARRLAAERGLSERLRFHHRNLADTGFAAAHFDRVLVSEATMYVDLNDAFAELARVLRPGGTLALITWCRNEAPSRTSPHAAVIDANHVCRTHTRSAYHQAIEAHGLVLRSVQDLTRAAIPYYQLRQQLPAFSEDSADEAYRAGYQDGLLQYIALVAERVPPR